jgi:hypothetical protein
MDSFALTMAHRLPARTLLDKQDGGTPLTPDEQAEAEGLVDLADLLTLLRLRVSKDTPTSG